MELQTFPDTEQTLVNRVERLVGAMSVKERVPGELFAKRLDIRDGNVPGRESAEDRDQNRAWLGQRRKSPLCPPRFSTRRMLVMVIRLSTALTMS